MIPVDPYTGYSPSGVLVLFLPEETDLVISSSSLHSTATDCFSRQILPILRAVCLSVCLSDGIIHTDKVQKTVTIKIILFFSQG